VVSSSTLTTDEGTIQAPSKGIPDFFPSKTFKFSPSKPKTITEVAIATLNCCGEKSTRIIKIFEKRVNN
jgi:hypothetical protein